MGNVLKATPEKILNTIRANASTIYQERIPEATKDNIAKIGEAILNYEPARNEFVNALINRIALVVVTSKLAENPLRMFKKGMLEFGDTVEEIFVDIAKAQQYDPEIAEKEVFKRVMPNISAMFHRMNRQNFYKVTIQNDSLRTAFMSYNGIEDLIARITDSLYNGDNYDEFILMKELFVEAANNGNFNTVSVPAVTDEASAKQFVTLVKGISNSLEFMSTAYNAANVLTSSPKRDQILFLLPKYDAMIDVDVLASAFNMDKAEFMGQRVLVDNFNGLEEKGVVALLVDRNFFMVWDNLFQFTEQYNAQGLYWNYFLHHWQILSTSLYSNAVAFVTQTPTVTAMTIAPSTVTNYVQGKSYQFNVQATGTGVVPSSSLWSIVGNTDSASSVSPTGLLYIGKNETGTITVTATNKFDNTITATATATATDSDEDTEKEQ